MRASVRTALRQLCNDLQRGDVCVITKSAERWRAARASTLGGALGALILWSALPLVDAPRVPALAVAPQLFKVGEHLCQKNEELRRIEITMPVNDRYTFICGNGARFEDTFARIKLP